MATLAGDLLEIRWSNPTVGAGSGVFLPKSNEGNTMDTGGFRVNDDANGITGTNELIWQLNNSRGSWEVVCANDMNVRNDLSVASQLAGSISDTEFTISHKNGTIWSCTGRPVGDIQADSNVGTFTLKVSGTPLEKIV